MKKKLALAWLLACLSLAPPAHADDKTERRAMALEMQAAWLRSDFAGLDGRYRDWRDRQERLPSGAFKATRMLAFVSGMLASEQPPRNDPSYEDSLTRTEEKIQRWQTQQPTSSLAAFALTVAYITHAFFYRGTGFASSVAEGNWKMFAQYIAMAAEHLADPALEHDNAWYAARISLSKFQDIPMQEKARLVDEATTRFPGDYSLYARALSVFEPQWGGSIEAFEWVADMGARKTRATEGEALYARIYWSLAQYADFGDDLFGTTRANWPRMKQGFDEVARRYPETSLLNSYALFACEAGDAATARRVLARIGDQIDMDVWKRRQRLNRCKELAHDTQ